MYDPYIRKPDKHHINVNKITKGIFIVYSVLKSQTFPSWLPSLHFQTNPTTLILSEVLLLSLLLCVNLWVKLCLFLISVFPSWPLSFCSSRSLINLFNWVESSICSHAHFSSFMAHLGKIIIIGLVQPGGLKSAGVLLSNSEKINRRLKACTLQLHLWVYQLSKKKKHKKTEHVIITPFR